MDTNELKNKHQVICKWIRFCLNYPYNFIEQCWDGNPSLACHLEKKFQQLYDDYGPYAVITKFYSELSKDNQEKLMTWVIEKRNDTN